MKKKTIYFFFVSSMFSFIRGKSVFKKMTSSSVSGKFPSTNDELLDVFIGRKDFVIIDSKKDEWTLLERLVPSRGHENVREFSFLGVVSRDDAIYVNGFIRYKTDEEEDMIVIHSGMGNHLNTEVVEWERVTHTLNAMGKRLFQHVPLVKKIQIKNVMSDQFMTTVAQSIMNYHFWRNEDDVFTKYR